MIELKTLWKVVGISALAFTLAACNSSAKPTKNTTNKSELTLEQVYNKAVERQENITSASATMEMTQHTTAGSGEEAMEFSIDSQMTMDVVVDPMAMHLSGSMSMSDIAGTGEEPASMPLEMYMDQNKGFFMKDMSSDIWMKFPDSDFDDILAQTASSADTKEQLAQLKPFINDFTFEQTDDAYVLTLEAEGERFKKLIEEEVEKSMQSVGLGENPLDQLQIDKIHYIVYIDKKTFDTTKMNMDFDLKMDIEGETLAMTTASVITYTAFNHLKTIDIPQEIIDNATVIDY
nr:DUF6612 family protein [Lysinibacillus sp. KH24]